MSADDVFASVPPNDIALTDLDSNSYFYVQDGELRKGTFVTLPTENLAMKEALEWYAKTDNWRATSIFMCGHSSPTNADRDAGSRARAALLDSPIEKGDEA